MFMDIIMNENFIIKTVLLLFVCKATTIVAANGVGQMDVFSTNTMLSWLNKSGVHQPDYLDSNVNFGVSTTNCRAIHVSMVVRQAAHFPARKELEQSEALHKKIMTNKNLSKELDHRRIPRFGTPNIITVEGKEEIGNLGSRIGHSFESFFSKFKNSYKFIKFVSSSDERTVKTLEYFYHALSRYVLKMPTFKSEINDSVLNFSKNCASHEEQLQDERVFLKQYYDFLQRSEFKNIMDSLKRKLGMQINLTEDDVFMINDWCSYGMIIYGDTPWCKLLSDNDRLVLEYGKDLLNYYKYSYGNPINAKMSCSLVRDIFTTFDSAINRDWNYFQLGEMSLKSYQAGKFQFGDADTIIPLVTALGLFKDKEPLLATNMAAMKNRKFKTSQISPFTGNVAFILYACDNTRRLALDEFSPGQQEIRIQAFVNEIRVPFCEHSYYCLYDDVKEQFKDFIKNCNMTDVCGTRNYSVTETTSLNSGMKRQPWHVLLILITLFIEICLS